MTARRSAGALSDGRQFRCVTVADDLTSAGSQGLITRALLCNLIRSGKPMKNAFVESFNGRFREECSRLIERVWQCLSV